MKGDGVGEGIICTVTYVCYEMVVFDMCFIVIKKNWIDVFIFVTQYH